MGEIRFSWAALLLTSAPTAGGAGFATYRRSRTLSLSLRAAGFKGVRAAVQPLCWLGVKTRKRVASQLKTR